MGLLSSTDIEDQAASVMTSEREHSTCHMELETSEMALCKPVIGMHCKGRRDLLLRDQIRVRVNVNNKNMPGNGSYHPTVSFRPFERRRYESKMFSRGV